MITTLDSDDIVFFFFTILFVLNFLYWIAIGIGAAFLRRWKRLAAIIASGITAVTATYFLLNFQDDIHFQIMRPIYSEELAHEKNVTTQWWDWDEGLGYDEGVQYIKNLAIAPPPEANDADCTDTSQRVGGHFFLETTGCRLGDQ